MLYFLGGRGGGGGYEDIYVKHSEKSYHVGTKYLHHTCHNSNKLQFDVNKAGAHDGEDERSFNPKNPKFFRHNKSMASKTCIASCSMQNTFQWRVIH